MSLLRRPLLHFCVIGSLLFAARSWWDASGLAGAAEGPHALVVTSERVAGLRDAWTARTGRPPTAPELAALIDAEIDDELLIREARRRGYHRTDAVVQQRLLRNMQFVARAESASPDELLAQAYALGMDRSDLVVRRRLVQRVQLEIFADARDPEPTEAELRAYMEEHRERYTQPERVHLTHVYLSRDRRGDALAADAEALLDRLVRGAVAPEDSHELGDPFLFERELALRSRQQLARLFGPDFADAAMALPEGRWAGPLSSAYGVHLAWLHERTPASPTPLEAAERQVREAIFGERGERALRAHLDELRARTPIAIEPADPASEASG